MIAGGVVNVEIFLLLKAISSCVPSFKYENLRSFCGAAWLFPNCTPGKVGDVFSEVRETSSLAAQTFKAGASEALSACLLIRYFLEITIMPRGLIPAEIASFLAVCRVLDLMDTIKTFGVGDRILRELKQEVARSLRLHVAAYGCEWVKPKHHYMIHMPRQVEEDGVWLDCFVHERKHQIIKEAAAHIKNTCLLYTSPSPRD